MKKALRLISYLCVVVILFSTAACYYDELVEDIPSNKIVSYTSDIQPIFTANCVSCHPTLVASPDLTDGNSYNSITNGYIIAEDPDASLLYKRLLGNPSIMPPSGSLPDSKISLIQQWIEQGALNN